jgi:hypothetical protein
MMGSGDERAGGQARRRNRRRFATYGGALALLLLVEGVVVARSSGGLAQLLGILCAGYGLGMGLAAALLASGRKPPRWRR